MDFSNVTQWNKQIYSELINELYKSSDQKYKAFHSSLVPDAEDDFILGVRMPKLIEIAKSISKGNGLGFLEIAGDKLYEERMLRGIVSGLIKTDSFAQLRLLCDDYIPLINNWALCDSFCSGLKQIKKYRAEAFEYMLECIKGQNVWQIRFALVCMLNYYLDDEYIDRVLAVCDRIDSDFYYVSMAQAWLLATALAKCREITYDYFFANKLSNATLIRAIQKSIESYRISDKDKTELKSLREKLKNT